MAAVTESCTSWLNRLLRGELSAVETYEQALNKCEGEPCAADVRAILHDHREAVAALREHVLHHGGDPTTSSGVWGTWAQVVTGAARVFGTRTTFRALREGEEIGVKEYERALADGEVASDCKHIIRTSLLPRQHEHIRRLDGLIEGGKDD